MIRSTVTPTNSGSMPPNVCDDLAERKSPEGKALPRWCTEWAVSWGFKPSYAKKLAQGDRNLFRMVTSLVRKMYETGNEQLADKHLLELDLIRSQINPCTSEHEIAVLEDAHADAQEDVARVNYIARPSLQTFREAERAGETVLRRKLRFLRSGRRKYNLA